MSIDQPSVAAPPTPGAEDRGVMRSYGLAATRDASIYGIGVAALLPFGLVSLAVTTRYLDTTEYGQVATLMAVAALLTLSAGFGIIQGTLMTAYRLGDDGVDGADGADDSGIVGDDDLGLDSGITADERRRLLGSGVVFSALQAGVVCSIVALAASPISSFLLGSASHADAVLWMALSAFTGAIWRMGHQVWRMERRPVIWVWFQIARPLLVVAATIVAFILDMGVIAPFVGTSVGTAAVIVLSLTCARRCYSLSPKWADYRVIWARGKGLVPIQIASVVQSNLAILVLTALAPAATVGVFAVAIRISQIPSFFAHGVLLAWPPLGNSPVGLALGNAAPRSEGKAKVFSLLFLGTLGTLVIVSLGSNAFVRIAASEYSAAADFIPMLSAAAAAIVIFRGIYRATNFPFRRLWYVGLHFFWVFPYIGALLLALPLGATWGVTIAEFIASVSICTIMALVDRFTDSATPFRWRQMLAATAVVAVVLTAVGTSPTDGVARAVLAIVTAIGMPLLLIRMRVIPRHQAELAKDIAKNLVPKRMSTETLASRLGRLSPQEREALELLVWQNADPQLAATKAAGSPNLLLARMVRGLRRFDEDDDATQNDADIGSYLLLRAGTIERDEITHRLTQQGVDPLDLHHLQTALKTTRRLRRRGRRTVRRNGLQPTAGASR